MPAAAVIAATVRGIRKRLDRIELLLAHIARPKKSALIGVVRTGPSRAPIVAIAPSKIRPRMIYCDSDVCDRFQKTRAGQIDVIGVDALRSEAQKV
jgi:hypothetical protein